VETSSCDRDIHKRVGDTVEISSCSAAEGVTLAQWKYNESKIVDNNTNEDYFLSQFTGRITLNRKSFNLTVRSLTLQDSGNFTFISEGNEGQRPTVIITLHIHGKDQVTRYIILNDKLLAIY